MTADFEETYKPAEDDKTDSENRRQRPKTFCNGDGINMAILVFLYILQGVPTGIAHAVPLILQERHITYKGQAAFNLVIWPYSLKVLWAPMVDSLYYSKFGRRKSWLIPVQYTSGLVLLLMSFYSDQLFGNEEGTMKPNIVLLTCTFFFSNFLAATQDVVVDGWSLTMLKKENIGHSSTCNAVGMTIGHLFGYVVFITMVSPSFCNKWIRSVPQATSIVSIPDFIRFWAVTFLVSTTLIAIFKKDREVAVRKKKAVCLNVFRYYKLAFDLFKLSAMKQLAILLFTHRIGFVSSDAVSPLKLIDKGLSRDKLALLAVPTIPLKIILPLLISKYLVGPRSLNLFVNIVPYRLGIDLLLCFVVFITPSMINDENLSTYYYIMLAVVHISAHMSLFIINTSSVAFFANISDPRSGGTYMTLLNTLANIGSAWPSNISLGLVDILTYRQCKPKTDACSMLNSTMCPTLSTELQCTIIVDGYYVEMFVCTILGLIWLCWARKTVDKLQNMDETSWRVNTKLFTALVKV